MNVWELLLLIWAGIIPAALTLGGIVLVVINYKHSQPPPRKGGGASKDDVR